MKGLSTLLAVAAFGALGASARYGIGLALARSEGLPWATLCVNLVGSLLLGLLSALLMGDVVPPSWRPALATGLLGSFTTFSTFSVESVRLLEAGDLRAALANIALHLGLGLLAAAVGLALGRAMAPT